MRGHRVAGLLLSSALLSCAHLPAGEGPGASFAEVGIASYYGPRQAGRTTASGERYDPSAFTCAHRTAPFGTRLRVTDLDTMRSVEVRVNDRGPAVKGRLLDLSFAAARALGLLERGIAQVRVERVR